MKNYIQLTICLSVLISIFTACEKDLPTQANYSHYEFISPDANGGNWSPVLLSGPEQITIDIPASTSSDIYQAELDELMTKVCAVLVVQRAGFGALTRLPELACAGIPVVTTQHATYAINTTPGVQVVDDHWSCWMEQLTQLQRTTPVVTEDAYRAWQAAQPQPLPMLIRARMPQ